MQIDLHTHSNCSDGSLSPRELLELAAQRGVEVLALTDHDTTAGLQEAAGVAAAWAITLVPGVEISTTWRGQDIHVLGLWIDPADPALLRALDGQAERRRGRIAAMCARLSKLRIAGDELLASINSATALPTRTHLAQALVNSGVVERTDQAFRKYLAKGKPAYAAADWPTLAEGVGWILQAGGCAVLAHPSRYKLSSGARQKLLADFAQAGGEGLEVVSGGNGAQHASGCAALAERFGFKGSVGSDFHGPQFAWNPLGRSLKLPDSITPVWRGRLP